MLPIDNLLVKIEELLKNKEYEELVDTCNQILEKEPCNEAAIHYKGKAYYYLKNYTESEKYLKKASRKYTREYSYLSPRESNIILD